VTSTILNPEQALEYMERVLVAEPRITVAGIAGPGDPFANPDKTLTTMHLLRKHFPDLILCLSSNGLGLPGHVEEVADIGVTHVTVTVNGIDPEITKKIYSFVQDNNVIYRHLQAAELLLARQMKAIEKLKSRNVVVKVNFITIPGINDHHAEQTAEAMAKMGVDIFNCMAMLPNANTAFANIKEPEKQMMTAVRSRCEKYLPQMTHCQRCRADAVGLLGKKRSSEMADCLNACAELPARSEKRPYVAVASLEGMLVNQHLGETSKFLIYGRECGKFTLIEERTAPPPGGGMGRWQALTRILYDCRAVLVAEMGESPRQVFTSANIKPVCMSGFIEAGLDAVYSGKGLAALKRREKNSCGSHCQGTGMGCG
jgi:nitrogen fixation protein NifB